MGRPIRQIDKFAELMSEWTAPEDARPDLPADPGGNAADCARRLGLKPSAGNGLLQRMRRDLGWQAR